MKTPIFKSLYLHAPQSMLVLDDKGLVVTYNPSFCKFFSIGEELLLSKRLDDFFGVEFYQQVKLIDSSMEKRDFRLSYKLIDKPIPLEICIYQVKEGSLTYTICQFNISSFNENESVILRELVDALPDNIYYKDLKSRFLFVNVALFKKHKKTFPNKKILGKTDFDLFSNEHAQKAYDDEQKIIETGISMINIEEKETWSDGSITWVSTSKLPLRDTNNVIIGTFGISKDITERKKKEKKIDQLNHDLDEQLKKIKTANEELIKSEFKFKGIFDNANAGISVSDRSGKIIMSNLALQQLIGCSEYELSNKYFYAYSHPDDLSKDLMLYEELIMGKISHYQLEKRLISTSGSVVHINMTVSLTQNKEDESQIVITIFDDITSRKDAESKVTSLNTQLEEQVEKLEDVNKELESFSYSVSHDLRAPLRAIDGFSKIVIEDYQDKLDEEGIRLLNVIATNSKKMSNLIDDLLSYSRISRKKTELKTINLQTIVEEIILELNFDKATFNIDTLPYIQGERTLIKQVYSNLINNAVKFSGKKDKPEIILGWTDKGEVLEFYVKDNGVGFDMRYYDKLFGVFQRLHSEEEFQGTGVGLAIVEKVISKHKGKVWAESKIDKGTTFYFTIPKEKED